MFFCAACILIVSGCDMATEQMVVPSQDLTLQQEKIIANALTRNDRDALRRIGSPAVPMILERIFEIYRSKPWRQDPVWADASNLVLLLGDIKDKRAVPALNMMVTNVKYRIFRGYAARALGSIRDARSIGPLWQAFREEKGYLEQGDRKGPDYGWGLAGNYTEMTLEHLGMALEKFGEHPGEYPKPFYGNRF